MLERSGAAVEFVTRLLFDSELGERGMNSTARLGVRYQRAVADAVGASACALLIVVVVIEGCLMTYTNRIMPTPFRPPRRPAPPQYTHTHTHSSSPIPFSSKTEILLQDRRIFLDERRVAKAIVVHLAITAPLPPKTNTQMSYADPSKYAGSLARLT